MVALVLGLAAAAALPRPLDKKDVRPIVARNLFCSDCAVDAERGAGAAALDLSLSRALALVATVVVPRAPAESRALVSSLAAPEAPPSLVAPGDRLFDTGAEVVAIAPRRLVARRGDAIAVLRIEAPSSGRPAVERSTSTRAVDCEAPGRCTIERSLVERSLRDPRLLGGARAVPALRDGTPYGWRIVGVSRGSPVAALGLENVDVVTAVDGTPIPTVDALLGVYVRLRNAARLTLTVERAGATRTLDVRLR
jgi:membrane-associated protease RseP (regulator of RpoE activity)